MRTAIAALATSAVLLVGCCGRGATYTVAMSSSFTLAQQTQVMIALDGWTDAVPVSFDLVMADCSEVTDRLICVRPVSRAPLWDCHEPDDVACTITTSGIDGGDVLISLDRTPDAFLRVVVAHEIGHAMGLQHDIAGTLMAHVSTSPDTLPTPRDVAQWHSLR